MTLDMSSRVGKPKCLYGKKLFHLLGLCYPACGRPDNPDCILRIKIFGLDLLLFSLSTLKSWYIKLFDTSFVLALHLQWVDSERKGGR